MDKQKALELALDCYESAVDSERWKETKFASNKGSDYYAGLQTYTEAQRDEMQRLGKPCLIFNEVLPIVNYITSVERDNRKDIKTVAIRNGFDEAAAGMSELMRHVLDQCEGEFVISDVFLNGVRNVIGYFKLEISYERDPVKGQIILRSLPTLAVKNDPACLNYNPNEKNGSSFMIHQEYENKELLKLQYPEEAKNIDDVLEEGMSHRSRGLVHKIVNFLFSRNNEIESTDENDDDILYDRDKFGKFKIKKTESWLREFVPRTLVIDNRTTENWFFDPKKDGHIIDDIKRRSAGHENAITIKEKWPLCRLNRVIHLGELLLEFEEEPYNGMPYYPIIPYSPFGEAQYDMSFEENLFCPQDELNKRMTNAVHILNSTANGGYKVKDGSDKAAMNELRQFGSSPNYIIELNKFGGSVEEVPPKAISQGHILLQGIDKNYMEEISGVTGASRGYDPSRTESGRLFQHKISQGLTTNRIIYDRFDQSVQIMGNTLLQMIRYTDTYTESEVNQIIDTNNVISDELRMQTVQQLMQEQQPPQPPDPRILALVNPDMQAMALRNYQGMIQEYQQWLGNLADERIKETIYKQIKDFKLYKYGAKVLQSPHAATSRMNLFYQLESIKDMFPIQVIGKQILRSLDLPKSSRDEMIKAFDQTMQGVMQ